MPSWWNDPGTSWTRLWRALESAVQKKTHDCICDLCWICQPESSKFKVVSHTSSPATDVTPRCHSHKASVCSHIFIFRSCVCLAWGFLLELPARVSPGWCNLWLSVATSFHTGIFRSFGAIYLVRYRMPYAATILEENLTHCQLEHFRHMRCPGGSSRVRLKSRRRMDLWGQGRGVMNTRVLWAALKLIAGEFDLSLQDRMVRGWIKVKAFDIFFWLCFICIYDHNGNQSLPRAPF